MAVLLTDEEKQAFLALLRVGNDPPTAAQMVNPEYTGSTFKRITNEQNMQYDAAFAAEYLRARAEGRQKATPFHGTAAAPKTTTLSGHVKAHYLTDEMLEPFLEQVAQGVPLIRAVEVIEPKTSLTQIARRANRDKDFAERYATAKEEGYPLFQERLRYEAVRQAENGDYRALRDLLLIHVPEYRVLMTQRHEISGPAGDAIRMVAERVLPDLPREMLDKLIEHTEKKRLGAGGDQAEAA